MQWEYPLARGRHTQARTPRARACPPRCRAAARWRRSATCERADIRRPARGRPAAAAGARGAPRLRAGLAGRLRHRDRPGARRRARGAPAHRGATAATILTTAVAVGLAELYSELVGVRVRLRTRCRREHRGAIAADVGAVVAGAGFPAVFFLLAAVGRARARHGVHDRQVVGPRPDRALRLLGGAARRRLARRSLAARGRGRADRRVRDRAQGTGALSSGPPPSRARRPSRPSCRGSRGGGRRRARAGSRRRTG